MSSIKTPVRTRSTRMNRQITKVNNMFSDSVINDLKNTVVHIFVF